jgi:hypothetical protein
LRNKEHLALTFSLISRLMAQGKNEFLSVPPASFLEPVKPPFSVVRFAGAVNFLFILSVA